MELTVPETNCAIINLIKGIFQPMDIIVNVIALW